MPPLVRYEVRDRVAVVTVDNPPLNALSAGVPEAISAASERACLDSTADAIVLIGAGTTFIAGADINIFKQLSTREQSIERSQAVHTRLQKLEDTDKPLVAAIHGHALGGGLEIVRGRATSTEVIATSVKLAKQLNKVGVVVGNCFGFVANRMLAYYMREAYLLLEEGASVSQIDNALTDFGYPVGPFGMQDIAGIDVGWRIRQHLKSTGQTRAGGPQSAVPDRLYESGRYGQKTGAGWYRYESGSRTRIPDPLVEEIAMEEARKRGVTRRVVSDEEIIARIMTALANEGARVLEEGYATRAGDIDVVYVNGFGFPRHRGGPMFYADTVGLATVLARVNEYRRQFGDYWRPARLLEQLAAEGRGFHGDAA